MLERVTMKTIIARMMVLSVILLLSGCIDKLKLTSYAVKYPVNDATYIGTVNQLAPNGSGGFEPLKSEFEITYSVPPSGEVDIVLNGHKISKYFVFGPTSAKGNIEQFKQFFRHGKNTLSVSPTSFGPVIIFNLDVKGPLIVVSRGEVMGSGASTKLEIEGYLRDFSLFDSRLQLDLVRAMGFQSDGRLIRQLSSTRNINVAVDGKFCAVDAGSPNLVAGRCANGAVPTGAVPIGTLLSQGPVIYSFTGKDIYGFETEREFSADTDGTTALPQPNAVQVAIGDSFIESMRPLIASSIYETLKAAPMDARCVMGNNPTNYINTGSTCTTWNDPLVCGVRGVVSGKNVTQAMFDKADIADSTANPKVKDGLVSGRNINNAVFTCQATNSDAAVAIGAIKNPPNWNADGLTLSALNQPIKVTISPLPTMNAYVQRFYMHDGSNVTIGGKNLTNKVGTVLLNGFKVKADNVLDIDLVLTELAVKLAIPGTTLSIPSLGMYIENLVVDTEAKVQAVNKDVDVTLQNSNFEFGGDLRLDNAQACIRIIIQICIPLDGLGNIFLPLLKGVVADLLPTILNPILEENLNKLVIAGAMVQPENQTKFKMSLDIAQMGTGNLMGPGSPYDLKVALDSLVDVKTSDSYVNPLLGPVFYDDPIDPSIMYNSLAGANLTVAINSNLINQSLAAAHATGVTFFTMHNGTIYYGAHPETPAIDPTNPASLTKALKGDVRIRLWPDMPPAIVFSETIGKEGEGRAAIEFESATLYLDELKDVSGQLKWVTNLELQVNFDLAVGIKENEGVFTMSAAGPPVFTINKMINRTPFLIPAAIVQGVLDTAMLFGGDLLADRFIVLDLGQLAEDNINGTVVRFSSSKDNWTLGTNASGEGCIKVVGGVEQAYRDPVTNNVVGTVSAGADGKYDVICHTIEFNVSTQTAGVTGAKGTNLFFQMTANDPAIPPPPAIPRFDLDDDGVIDYRDNCALPITMLVEAVKVNGGPAAPGNLDAEGNPSVAYSNAVKAAANNLLVTQKGAASPTNGDIDWLNTMRIGDLPVAYGSNWLRTLYANRNQSNTDGDRTGDLCENDDDRDGVWADYNNQVGKKNDNCPYTYNPDQADNYPVANDTSGGAGDACNIRQTFILLKNQKRGECITHYNFSTNNSYTALGWAACDQANPAQRWYFKENTAETPPANSAVAQLWQTQARNGFYMATEIKSGTTGATTPTFINADDVMLTNHANYKLANFNDWIFADSGDANWPYIIKSYKFYKRDGASSNWCVFEKDINRPDQDNNSCTTTSYGAGAMNFQILVGPSMAKWTGTYD